MGNKFRFSQVWLFQSSIDAKNESIWEIRSEAKPLKIKKIEKSKCLKRLKFARRPTVKGGSSTHTHPTNLTVLLLRLLRPSFSRPYYFSLKNLISNLEARLLIKCPQHRCNFSESQVCHEFFEFAGSWPKSRENKSTKASLRDHHVWQPLLKGQLNRGLVSKGHTNQLQLNWSELSEEAPTRL